MYIAMVKIKIQLLYAHSLKDKRMTLKSLKDKAFKRYRADLVEVDDMDIVNLITLGCAVVSNSYQHADERAEKLIDFIYDEIDDMILSVQKTVHHMDDFE